MKSSRPTRHCFRLAAHILLVALLALACGTATFIVQQYDGEPRDAERISLLRLNGGTKVVVVALDGEELSYVQDDRNTRVHIEMLPGEHELDIGNLDDPLHRIVTLNFVAEAGKVYRVTIDSLDEGSLMRPWNALMWEVDRDSDRTLRTVPPRPSLRVPTIPSGSSDPAPSATASAAPPTATSAPTIADAASSVSGTPSASSTAVASPAPVAGAASASPSGTPPTPSSAPSVPPAQPLQ